MTKLCRTYVSAVSINADKCARNAISDYTLSDIPIRLLCFKRAGFAVLAKFVRNLTCMLISVLIPRFSHLSYMNDINSCSCLRGSKRTCLHFVISIYKT